MLTTATWTFVPRHSPTVGRIKEIVSSGLPYHSDIFFKREQIETRRGKSTKSEQGTEEV